VKIADFNERLKDSILIADGAMGSMLHESVGSVRCFDELNSTEPEAVFRVHQAYIEAGAQIIETNTFGANRFKLTPLGLGEEVQRLNGRGVKIAREARESAPREVLIAGSIGPLGIGFIFEGGLTFDVAGRLIGVDQGDAATATTFEIDTATGAATIIGPPGGQARDINGLTRDGTVVYGIDRPSNSLGRLDVATGSYTQIGLTGATIGDTGGLAFDQATGALYATFAADGGFYRIDPATGTATLIAVNQVDYGLAFAPPDKPGQLLTYSVKFVCGVRQSQEPAQTVVRPGIYATEINIHNYHDMPVRILKYVLPLVF